MCLQRVARADEAPDSLQVILWDIADGKERDRAVGRHLLGAAVGEQGIAGEHSREEVADDHPADDLHDKASGTLWADRLSKEPAEGRSGGGSGYAPEDDPDEHSPDEARFARPRFGQNAVLNFDGSTRYAEVRQRSAKDARISIVRGIEASAVGKGRV